MQFFFGAEGTFIVHFEAKWGILVYFSFIPKTANVVALEPNGVELISH